MGRPPRADAGGDVFAAIASPVRRELLDALRGGPRSVHELAAGFAISRPAVSQHLKVLREARLVAEDRTGRESHYRLDPAPLREVGAWVEHYEQFWRSRMARLRDVLEEQP